MSDRESNTPSDGTAELPPAERRGTAGTEPIAPGEPHTPPPPGGYGSIGSRRRGPVVPVGWIVVAVVVLAVAFVLGFFVGRGQAPQSGGGDRVEHATGKGKQQDGGGQKARRKQRKACRRALDLSAQVIEGQQRALENQAALVEAIVAEEAAQVEALTAAGEQLQSQIAQAQAAFAQALQRCRG